MEIPFKILRDLAGLPQPLSLLIIQYLLIFIEKCEALCSFICSLMNWFKKITTWCLESRLNATYLKHESDEKDWAKNITDRDKSSTKGEEEEESAIWHSRINVVLRNTHFSL